MTAFSKLLSSYYFEIDYGQRESSDYKNLMKGLPNGAYQHELDSYFYIFQIKCVHRAKQKDATLEAYSFEFTHAFQLCFCGGG